MSISTKLKLLYLEDDASVANLYSRALGKAGYNVILEQDGAAGLELASSNTYDIILLDLMLPHLSGIEILSRLREQIPPIKSKIVITTNLEQEGQARAAIEQQADGYLVKADTTPRQLVDFLSRLDTGR